MKYHCFLFIIIFFSIYFGNIFSYKCLDGKTNVIKVRDISARGQNYIEFKNIKILTYDAAKKPFCQDGEGGSIHLPGFIKIFGTAEILQPIDSKEKLLLEFSLEHNSFLIGLVCRNGKSENSFVPDSFCTFDFCELLSDYCGLLSVPGRVELDKFVPQMIPLGPAAVPYIEGEWKASAVLRLKENAKKIASITADGWQNVKVGDETSKKIFEDQPEAILLQGKSFSKKEL